MEQATLDDVLARLRIALERGDQSATVALGNRKLVAKADDYGQYAEVELNDGVDPQDLLKELVGAGVRVNRFEVAEPTLNKIFIDLVGADAATAPVLEGPING